jgi:hypothetical protein
LDVQVIKSLITATKHRFGPIQREPTVEDGPKFLKHSLDICAVAAVMLISKRFVDGTTNISIFDFAATRSAKK